MKSEMIVFDQGIFLRERSYGDPKQSATNSHIDIFNAFVGVIYQEMLYLKEYSLILTTSFYDMNQKI